MALTFERIDPVPVWDDARLMALATDRERRLIEGLRDYGSYRLAAEALGCCKSNIGDAIKKLQARAARDDGYAPGHWQAGVAPGYRMGKVTIQRKQDDGTYRWERQHPDAVKVSEMVRDAVEAFMEPLPPAKPFAVPDASADVVPWIQIGDAHIGMLAHEAEAGADFNVEIAQREMCAAFRLLIDRIEPCERLVINDLGDFTHFENTEKVTAKSRHALDGERPRLMIRTASFVMRFVIDLALTKARNVDVIVNQGNHSRFGDFYMNELLTVAYQDNPRVNILDNESPFIGYRMGNTLVMTSHSDLCKPDRLPEVMASDFQQDFAETSFHYIDIGHIHHKLTSKERDGTVLESWNTTARGDKWHRDSGYRARQSMSVVFRSRTYGEIGRQTVPIEMVYDAIKRGHDGEGINLIPTKRRAFAV